MINISKEYSVDYLCYSLDDRYIGAAASSLTGSLWNGQISIVDTNAASTSSTPNTINYSTHNGNTCLKWLSNDSLIVSSDDAKLTLVKLDDIAKTLIDYANAHSSSSSSDSTTKPKPPPVQPRGSNILESLFSNAHDNIISSIDIVTTDSAARLLSASWDRTIKLWDIQARSMLSQFNLHSSPVHSVVANGPLIASSSVNRVVVADSRSKDSGTVLNHSLANGIGSHSICWRRNVELLCASDNGDIFILDTRSMASPLKRYTDHHQLLVNQIRLNPHNDNQFATVSDDKSLIVFDSSNDTTVKRVHLESCIRALDWNKSVAGQLVIGTVGKQMSIITI